MSPFGAEELADRGQGRSSVGAAGIPAALPAQTRELILKPRSGWQAVDLPELWSRRELLQFLVWRDVTLRYRQTILGGIWAVLQPLLAMLIFTFFFHNLVGINTNGPPYPLFAYAGLLLWTLFSNAVTNSSNSLVGNQMLVSKVYFPRVFLPLSAIGAPLLDLSVGLLLMATLMAYYHWSPGISIFSLPLYIFGTILAAGGVGLILSALNVRFRDVKFAVPFFVQMGLFVSPVIYPLSYVPARFQVVWAINPMVGLIEGFRNALLGGETNWQPVVVSGVASLLLFGCGLLLFRRMEREFADII